MDMIFRSVVGKLWMTIIALFALVLTVFSLLLVQSFDSYYFHKQTNDLKELTERLSTNIEESANKQMTLQLASDLCKTYRTRLFVIDSNKQLLGATDYDETMPNIPFEMLINQSELHIERALAGEHPNPARLIFPGDSNGPKDRVQVLAVAVPHPTNAQSSGAVIMYQAIEDFNGTVSEVRKLIFIVGVIGFIGTTVFAFFLSSRITYPLRKMKETAHRIAEGDIHAEIPIRTTDEIGELASSFNTMASTLNNLVHALSKEKEQLASVLSSMADGVIMIDGEGQIVVTNPAGQHFIRDWLFERQMTPLYDLYQRVVKQATEVSEDYPVQGRIWSVVMAPLYDREQIRGAVAVLRDMTQERKLDKLRQDFVANVSHELRTPLSMLQGYSEAIVDDIAATPEEHKELARIIYDESVRMTKLVNELLDLARMEAGHIELHREVIPLKPYLERIQRKFINLGREREIAILIELATTLENVNIDPDRLEQVLTNLIDNAVRHTPPGGSVTIRASGENPLVLEVADTGSGIPQEDLPFVFERFYKADKARTRGRAGTGLGLAIAKNIVDSHGGTISVQSKMGEGTCFTILLPQQIETKHLDRGKCDDQDDFI